MAPDLPSSQQTDMPDRFVKMMFHGIPGVWIEGQAYNDMLVGFVLERGDLMQLVANARALQRIAEDEATAVRKAAGGLEWRAVWGPILGFLGGALLTTAIVLGAVYAGKALAPSSVGASSPTIQQGLHFHLF